MTTLPLNQEQPDDQPTFLRTATGVRAHLPDCPHLVGTIAHTVDDADFLALPVCEWSTAQIQGYGRKHLGTVDDAMSRIGVPAQGRPAIAQGLKFVTYDDVFVVHSLTYAALGQEGRIVAGFGKTYYWVGDARINLPDYVDSSRHGRTAQRTYGDICPFHSVAMSVTGECERCS